MSAPVPDYSENEIEIISLFPAGPPGPPGTGVILLEVGETEPPVDTPVGTIIYRKV